MKYPAYPDHRPVHSPNLRQLPAHWAVNRVKFIATVGNGSTPSRDESAYWQEGTFPWLNSSVVNQEVVTDADQFVTAMALRECHLPRVVPPAVLVGITGEGRTRGLATTLAIEATINQHLVFVKPVGDKVDVRFLRRVFDASYDHLRSDSEGAGSTKGAITCEQIKEMTLPVPPSDEQREIAAFLDWRTAQIDALIAKKQALIDRLREQRQSMIAQHVTQGLNPQSPMRETATPWLRRIPAHWDCIPLGFLASMSGGMTPSMNNPDYWDGNLPWVTPKDMKQAEVHDSIDHVTALALSETGLSLVPPGAILIVVRGMILAHSFPTAMVRAPVTINQDMKALRCTDRLDSDYLFWCLNGFAGVLINQAQESAHGTKKMETETIKKFVLPVPPIEEQRDIAQQLNKALQKLDESNRLAMEAIERLTEYRSALIAAAVTGQIDVRAVKVPAPA